MGNIANLRKQFKSKNTYDFIKCILREEKKPIISFLRFE